MVYGQNVPIYDTLNKKIQNVCLKNFKFVLDVALMFVCITHAHCALDIWALHMLQRVFIDGKLPNTILCTWLLTERIMATK